jgi:hypothetical protein
MKLKYPRTPHLPGSSLDPDDFSCDPEVFKDKEVVVSLKLDGANTTIAKDYVHGRSLEYKSHESRDHIKELQSRVGWQLDDLRICGENMWAVHTLEYNDLESYFYVISIWRDKTCLSWEETVETCYLLDLITVPVIYDGVFDLMAIEKSFKPFLDKHEGYVVRLKDEFSYEDFERSVAKYRVPSFDNSKSVNFFTRKVVKNQLKQCQVMK